MTASILSKNGVFGMSIYSFSDIELQAYKNIWIAIQNYDVHAELPAIDSEKVLTLYKKY